MCDISKHTKTKKITVYKIVIKRGDAYFSQITEWPIELGDVPITFLYDTDNTFYNKDMIGRTCGFKKLKDAKKHFDWITSYNSNITILRMVLSSDLMIGTATNYTRLLGRNHIVYAGKKVESFKELKL